MPFVPVMVQKLAIFLVQHKYRHHYTVITAGKSMRALLIFVIIVNDCCKSERYYLSYRAISPNAHNLAMTIFSDRDI
jgi:hypothetical protein